MRFRFAICCRVVLAFACFFFARRTPAQHWERLGPEGGQILSLAEANDGTIYLGTPDGHVFASNDQGENWGLRGRVTPRADAVIQTLSADLNEANRLFAGVWYLNEALQGGVFQSEDGGRSWTAAGLAGEAVRALEQSPSEPALWIAGTRKGVFRSRDAGTHWEQISPQQDVELANIDSVAIDPKDSKTIYVGTYHLPWKTSDGGKSWNSIHSGMIDDSDVMSIRIDRDNPSRIFASACSGIYRSEDAGGSWTKLQGIPYTSRRTQQILQDPVDRKAFYAATTEGLWLSRDAGENWARVTSRDTVVNAIAVPKKNGRLLIGTDEGILASDDAGQTFRSKNRGFSHRVISAMAQDPGAPGHLLILLASSQLRLLESNDSGQTWGTLKEAPPFPGAEQIFGSSAGWCVSIRGGGLFRYDSKLEKWKAIKFLAPAPKSRGHEKPGRTSGPKAQPTLKPPRVLQVAEKFGLLYVTTTDGAWSGPASGFLLRRFESSRLKGAIRDVSLGNRSCFLMSESKIECLKPPSSWDAYEGPPGQEGQWISEVPEDRATELIAGTDHGVFAMSADKSENWKLRQAGLPSTKAGRVAFSGVRLGIGMANGGFYTSDDAGKSWVRRDQASETGIAVGVAGNGAGGFVVASRTEGILRWVDTK